MDGEIAMRRRKAMPQTSAIQAVTDYLNQKSTALPTEAAKEMSRRAETMRRLGHTVELSPYMKSLMRIKE